MTTTDIVLSILSIIGTLSSILFAYLAFHRNNKADVKNEARDDGQLISDVGYIRSTLDRIERQLSKLEEKYDDLQTRVIRVEQKLHDHIKNKEIHNQTLNTEDEIK